MFDCMEEHLLGTCLSWPSLSGSFRKKQSGRNRQIRLQQRKLIFTTPFLTFIYSFALKTIRKNTSQSVITITLYSELGELPALVNRVFFLLSWHEIPKLRCVSSKGYKKGFPSSTLIQSNVMLINAVIPISVHSSSL